MPQLIDLSMPIEEHPLDPNFVRGQYIQHVSGGERIWRALLFPRRATMRKRLHNLWRYLRDRRTMSRHSFPDGMFLSNEIYTLSVHCGTHLDAPYHFGPSTSGAPARTIDQVPLEWCFGHGVILDLSHKQARELISAADIQAALDQIGYQLRPMDIVLIRTDADKLWPRPEYFIAHAGMTDEATRWLVEQGVKVIGIDTNGFDLPLMEMVNRYLATKDQQVLWPAHMYGRQREYLHIERMANLDRVPRPFGFQIACFPIAIRNAGAAWIRPVAIV